MSAATCPVCNRRFRTEDLQQHVNVCLDLQSNNRLNERPPERLDETDVCEARLEQRAAALGWPSVLVGAKQGDRAHAQGIDTVLGDPLNPMRLRALGFLGRTRPGMRGTSPSLPDAVGGLLVLHITGAHHLRIRGPFGAWVLLVAAWW